MFHSRCNTLSKFLLQFCQRHSITSIRKIKKSHTTM
nr:MAG TPA: hypothetical protein [Caudoviricetes sp.]